MSRYGLLLLNYYLESSGSTFSCIKSAKALVSFYETWSFSLDFWSFELDEDPELDVSEDDSESELEELWEEDWEEEEDEEDTEDGLETSYDLIGYFFCL